jgi:hypothetical protein
MKGELSRWALEPLSWARLMVHEIAIGRRACLRLPNRQPIWSLLHDEAAALFIIEIKLRDRRQLGLLPG